MRREIKLCPITGTNILQERDKSAKYSKVGYYLARKEYMKNYIRTYRVLQKLLGVGLLKEAKDK